MSTGSLKKMLVVWAAFLLALAALATLAPTADARMSGAAWNAFICENGGGTYLEFPDAQWGCAYPNWYIVCGPWGCVQGGDYP